MRVTGFRYRRRARRGYRRSPLALQELTAGDRARVVSVPEEPVLLRKLAALGILPGVELTLLQRVPTCVVRVGHSDVALGGEIASLIKVDPE